MTATATATAPVISSAQVGNGRIPHRIRTDGFHAHTLCGRRAARVLTETEAAKAPRHCSACDRALASITRTSQQEAAPAAQEETAPAAPVVPGDVVRPGVTIRKRDRMQWTVERAGHMAVIFDEEGMKRGRWAVWSPFAGTPQGIVLFTHDAEEAVDAALATLPALASTLAEVAGVTMADVMEEAAVLAEEWKDQPRRLVLHAKVLKGDAELSGPAALVILEALATRAAEASAKEPAAEAAPAPGEPEWRTLKGVAAPCFLYGTERDGGRWWPAGDRKQVTGEPLLITRLWTDRGMRYAEDVNGREIPLFGAAGKYWTAPAR